tara:strand:- start:1736 stop:2431 length:696 start_codon:yes stop_codon:yes gene_type:complete
MGCGCGSSFSGDKKASKNIWNNVKGNSTSADFVLPNCYVCDSENTYSEPDERGTINQLTGCKFNDEGEVIMYQQNPNVPYMTNNGLKANCPTSGWNAQGLYVTSNAPTTSGGSSQSPNTLSSNSKINKRTRKDLKNKKSSTKMKGMSKSMPTAKKCSCGKDGNCTCGKSLDSRFSAFMGKVKTKRNFVDTKKHGIADEEFFAYNPKQRGNFSNFTDGRGFKHNNELDSFDF